MPGGLLTLVSTGPENVILNSNPKKSFFKAVYAKHTNFGMQKFILNYDKEKELSFLSETDFTFKVPRFGDLINDTFISLKLPKIYSPFYYFAAGNTNAEKYIPYKFQWIKNLGTSMIKEIQIYAGGLTLAKYSGEYIHCIVNRDLNKTKKDIFDKITGHTNELNDPEAYIKQFCPHANNPDYPTSYANAETTGETTEASIQEQTLHIPLYSWFSQSSKLALPLIALQYQEVFIKITFRPIKELYTILDVESIAGGGTVGENIPEEEWENHRISPNPNNALHQLNRFLRVPKDDDKQSNPVVNTPNNWFSNLHLSATYIFLDEHERNKFAKEGMSFLIKQVVEHEFLSKTGSKKIDVDSAHCVTNYMLRFRRSDVNDRNEWTNFTNWDYENKLPQFTKSTIIDGALKKNIIGNIGIYPKNIKNILLDMGIILNGDYRENILDKNVYLYSEKYSRTNGIFKEGLYHYSFALNTDLHTYQPSGSMNMSKFDHITFEYNTVVPPKNDNNKVEFMCAGNGDILGIRQDSNEVYKYNYDFKVFEERYNVITIANGNINLMLTN